MVLVKNWQFFHLSISAKKLWENVFDDILERENTLIDNKNNNLIKSKNWYFSRGCVKNGPFFHIVISAKK